MARKNVTIMYVMPPNTVNDKLVIDFHAVGLEAQTETTHVRSYSNIVDQIRTVIDRVHPDIVIIESYGSGLSIIADLEGYGLKVIPSNHTTLNRYSE